MRKVRREVLKTINELRTRNEAGTLDLNIDEYANRAAEEYAYYLLAEDKNDQTVKKLCENHHVVNHENIVAIYGYAYFEDDFESPDRTRFDEYMDAHGLLLELQKEREMLCDKKYTHVGIGFSMDG